MSEYRILTENEQLVVKVLGFEENSIKNLRDFRNEVDQAVRNASLGKIFSLLDSIEDEKKKGYAIRGVRSAIKNRK